MVKLAAFRTTCLQDSGAHTHFARITKNRGSRQFRTALYFRGAPVLMPPASTGGMSAGRPSTRAGGMRRAGVADKTNMADGGVVEGEVQQRPSSRPPAGKPPSQAAKRRRLLNSPDAADFAGMAILGAMAQQHLPIPTNARVNFKESLPSSSTIKHPASVGCSTVPLGCRHVVPSNVSCTGSKSGTSARIVRNSRGANGECIPDVWMGLCLPGHFSIFVQRTHDFL